MKKTLFLMASVALLASCNTDMLVPEDGQASSAYPGITFGIAQDETRGMIDKDGAGHYLPYFFAEQDRIDIWALNVNKGYNPGAPWTTKYDVAPMVAWPNAFTNATAQYKATSSKGNPNFTAVDNTNMLGFRPYTTFMGEVLSDGEFFVAYPSGQQIQYNNVEDRFEINPGPGHNLQTQIMGEYMDFDKRFMYDYVVAGQKDNTVMESNASVGEKVQLELKTPLTTAIFKINDIEENSTLFGNLNTISITSQRSAIVPAVSGQEIVCGPEDLETISGKTYLRSELTPKTQTYAQTGNYVQIPATTGDYYAKNTCKEISVSPSVWALTTNSVKINLSDPDTYSDITEYEVGGASERSVGDVVASITYNDYFYFYPEAEEIVKSAKPEGEDIVNKATLSVNRVVENNEEMLLFVLPTTDHAVKPETYNISYVFDKVTLTYQRTTAKDFELNKGLTFTLNIANEFPFIVTSDKDLIVNKKDLQYVFNGTNNVVFNGSAIDPTTIKTVTIKATADTLDAADWVLLNKFTGAESLVLLTANKDLKNITSMTSLRKLNAPHIVTVYENAIGSVGTNITEMRLPNVTSFKSQGAANKCAALINLELSKYDFEEEDGVVPDYFFASTKGTLKTVDLSSVKSLAPKFGFERNILFKDFTELVSINLNSEGTIISATEFNNCGNLTTVTGKVKMETANNAFDGCINLDEVSVIGTVIPEGAFKSSGVYSILEGGHQIIPTYVGKDAFANNQEIVAMDLRKAETIGAGAFNGATKFKGTGKNGVVTLYVATVEENAFNNTIVERFQLKEAKTTKSLSLGSTALKQIKYRKSVISIAADQVQSALKPSIQIFIANPTDASKFSGYYLITGDDTDWEE